MEHNYTVPSDWLVALFHTLEFHGCDGKGIFKQAGVDLESIRDSAQRFAVKPVYKVWQIGETRIGIPHSVWMYTILSHPPGKPHSL